MKSIDHCELDAFDQYIELISLVVRSILVLVSILAVQLAVPPIALLAQITNVVFTVIFWLGYKIARTRLSIDLRFWVIVEGVTFAQFIFTQAIIQIPSILSLDLPPLLFTGGFMLLILFIDVPRSIAVSFVLEKWERIRNVVERRDGPDSLDLNALYLLIDARPYTLTCSVVGIAFALVILSVYINPSNLGIYLIPTTMLPLILLYLLRKIRRSQGRLLRSEIEFEEGFSPRDRI